MRLVFSMVILTSAAFTQIAAGIDYSIYELQYQSDPEDLNSPYVGEDVNCVGGIVTHKYAGKFPKAFVQDPCFAGGWGGITVKDFSAAKTFYNTVNIGDRVSLTHTIVEESSGNTQLDFDESSGFVVESTGNDLPEPILIEPNDITAPVYQLSPEGWLVQNHNAEKYEAMLVRVRDVIVTEKDLGKAEDNYGLESYVNAGPNDICWAADYTNEEVEADGYHRFVELDSRFCGVTGIIEQYDGYKNFYEWDYYQLLTTCTADFTITQKGDFDDDCDVDFIDFDEFASHWPDDGCAEPNWCGGADLTENGFVNTGDLKEFARSWLEGKIH